MVAKSRTWSIENEPISHLDFARCDTLDVTIQENFYFLDRLYVIWIFKSVFKGVVWKVEKRRQFEG